MKSQRILSIRLRVSLYTAAIAAVAFIIFGFVSIKKMEASVEEAMINEFIHVNEQIAEEAADIIAYGENSYLQDFVEELVADNSYIAYAVVIDTNVKAVAHSDTIKIGKSYADDDDYTVPAAKEGVVKTSKFWADVQAAWTYDIMCPIIVNGVLYGSMDVGIYNTEVSNSTNKVRISEIYTGAILVFLMVAGIFIISSVIVKPFSNFIDICDKMGRGDFTGKINFSDEDTNDEIGKMAQSLASMKLGLTNLIHQTEDNAKSLYFVTDKLRKKINAKEREAKEHNDEELLQHVNETKKDLEELVKISGRIEESLSEFKLEDRKEI